MDRRIDTRLRTDPVAVLTALKRQIYSLPSESSDVVYLAQLYLLIKRALAAGLWRNGV
jgi:hypothetical protein